MYIQWYSSPATISHQKKMFLLIQLSSIQCMWLYATVAHKSKCTRDFPIFLLPNLNNDLKMCNFFCCRLENYVLRKHVGDYKDCNDAV